MINVYTLGVLKIPLGLLPSFCIQFGHGNTFAYLWAVTSFVLCIRIGRWGNICLPSLAVEVPFPMNIVNP